MTDEQNVARVDGEPKPGRKVIGATVRAQAGPATVAINQPPKPKPFYVREIFHRRMEQAPEGDGYVQHTVKEYRPELDSHLPEGFWQFEGIGTLTASFAPDQPPHTGQFNFPLPAATLEEAWAIFDEKMKPAAEKARIDFLKQLQEHAAAVQRTKALGRLQIPRAPGPAADPGLVHPHTGQPLKPPQ